MRLSSKEELIEYIEGVKDRIKEVSDNPRTPTEIQSELNEIVSDIKDTLYWV